MDSLPRTPDPDRIVIYAESGLLAGDLTALLSGLFRVERVTSVPGAILALDQHPTAMILVEGSSLTQDSKLIKLVEQCFRRGVKVLLLGVKPLVCPEPWAAKATFLAAMPKPADLLIALKTPSPKEFKAEG